MCLHILEKRTVIFGNFSSGFEEMRGGFISKIYVRNANHTHNAERVKRQLPPDTTYTVQLYMIVDVYFYNV